MVGNNAWMQNIKEWIEQNHPNLVTTGYQITAPLSARLEKPGFYHYLVFSKNLSKETRFLP